MVIKLKADKCDYSITTQKKKCFPQMEWNILNLLELRFDKLY